MKSKDEERDENQRRKSKIDTLVWMYASELDGYTIQTSNFYSFNSIEYSMTTSFAMHEKVKAILGLRFVFVSNAIKIKLAVQPGYFDNMVEYCSL